MSFSDDLTGLIEMLNHPKSHSSYVGELGK